MRVYYNGLKVEEISEKATKDEVRMLLAKMTDEDFNGNNGKDYYVEEIIDGKVQLMSSLDSCMMKFEEYDNIEDFIEYVLDCNYSESYYTNYDVVIKNIADTLVVSLASAYSC